MSAAIGLRLRHRRAVVEPDLRIGLAKADGERPNHELFVAERRQHLLVEGGAGGKIAHRDRGVVDHVSSRLDRFCRVGKARELGVAWWANSRSRFAHQSALQRANLPTLPT